jgi:hypothetical protein
MRHTGEQHAAQVRNAERRPDVGGEEQKREKCVRAVFQ